MTAMRVLRNLLAFAGCVVALYIGNYLAVHLGARYVSSLAGAGYSLVFPWQGLVPPLSAWSSYTFLFLQIIIYAQYRFALSVLVGMVFARLSYAGIVLASVGLTTFTILHALSYVAGARNSASLYALIIIPHLLVPVGAVLGKKLGGCLRRPRTLGPVLRAS